MPGEGVGTPATLCVSEAAPGVSSGQGARGRDQSGVSSSCTGPAGPFWLLAFRTHFTEDQLMAVLPGPAICTLGFLGGTLLGVGWQARP